MEKRNPPENNSYWDKQNIPSTSLGGAKIPDLRWMNKKNIALVFTESDDTIADVILVTTYLASGAKVQFVTDKQTLNKELSND